MRSTPQPRHAKGEGAAAIPNLNLNLILHVNERAKTSSTPSETTQLACRTAETDDGNVYFEPLKRQNKVTKHYQKYTSLKRRSSIQRCDRLDLLVCPNDLQRTVVVYWATPCSYINRLLRLLMVGWLADWLEGK